MRFGTKLPTRRYGITQRSGVIKIAPNEACPCGSGKKYKMCCGAAKGVWGWWCRHRARQTKLKALTG